MQKLSLLVLLLSLTFCYTNAQSAYQALDVAEAQSSPEIQKLIQFGLQAIVENGVQKEFFSSSDFALNQINSVAEEIGDGNNYQFDCIFQDSTGIKIAAKFEVHQDDATNTQSLISFAYNVYYPSQTVTDPEAGEESTEETGEEVQIESPSTSVPEVEENQNGEAATPDDGIEITIPEDNTAENTTNTTIPENKFVEITEEEFDNSTQMNEIFQFGFANVIQNGIKNNSIPNTNFTFAVITSLAKKTVENGEIYKFSCKATDRKNVEINLSFQVVQEVQSFSYQVKITSNDTNTTNPTEPTNTTQPAENEEAQKALKFGVEQVVDSGIKKGKVPAGNYSVSEVISTTSKNVTGGVNYIFEVRVVNEKKTVFISTNFTVNVKTSTKKMTLSAYYLKVNSNEPKPTTPTTPPTNNTTPTAPTTPTTPPTNNTTPTTPTTPPTNNTTPTTPTTPPVNNTTPTPNNTNNGYVQVDAATIASDAVIQDAIAFGVDKIVKAGVEQGRMPAAAYNVTEVVSVAKKANNKEESYKCVVNLANADGVKVNAKFTIVYTVANKTMAMTAFSYKVTNIPVPKA